MKWIFCFFTFSGNRINHLLMYIGDIPLQSEKGRMGIVPDICVFGYSRIVIAGRQCIIFTGCY